MSPLPEPARAVMVRHNRVDLALHVLAPGDGGPDRPLLLLHGLGEATPSAVPVGIDWPGPVLGLDFTGHGASTVPAGGGYTSEILVGDVDAALEWLGVPLTLVGRGLGAYVALLVAAARPDRVRGAVLADGPGLAGGGVHPGSPSIVGPGRRDAAPPDPWALVELARDVRPPDYARTFAGFVVSASDLDTPLWVATVVRPSWVEALASEPGVGEGTVAQGLSLYAGL